MEVPLIVKRQSSSFPSERRKYALFVGDKEEEEEFTFPIKHVQEKSLISIFR